MTETRIYTSGEKPVNPIVRDVVYIISDVREEPNEQHGEEISSLPQWSYVVDEVVSLGDYVKRMQIAHAEEIALMREEHAEEIAELDGALFEVLGIVSGGM